MPGDGHVDRSDFMGDGTVVVGSLRFHLHYILVNMRCHVVDSRQLGQGQKTQLYSQPLLLIM